MSFSEEAYLQIIDNWIQCEDKIVTYIHLALELGVPCNQAKSMLYTYVHKARSIPSHPVFPVFIISGYISPYNMLVKLVPEKELESTKTQFTRILSLHIYSICKYIVTKASSIQKALNLITQDKIAINKLSLIKNSHIRRRTLKLKSGTQTTVATKVEKDTPKPSNSIPKIPVETKLKPNKISHKIGSNKSTINSKQPKNRIMFSSTPKSKPTTQVCKVEEQTKPEELNNIPAYSEYTDSESSESEMGSKPRRYFPPSLPVEVVQSHTERPKVTGFLEDDSDDDFEEEIPIREKRQQQKQRQKQRQQQQQQQQLHEQQQQAQEQLEQLQQQQQTVVVEKQIPEQVRINPVTGKRRKRIQKLVDECYEDNSGALITKKKYVMVSTDESSEEEIKNTKLKPLTVTKQSSLNCFFKK